MLHQTSIARRRGPRKTGFRRFFIAWLLCLPLQPATATTPPPSADREINQLIQAVESSACTFIRNGDAHDAASAADHLRLKYRRGQRYADTAEHFIERLASKSSWSGDPYFIECGSNRDTSALWLRRKLEEIRGENLS